MQQDEKAIRALVEKFMAATRSGDTGAVLSLMADDVVFMVPGKEPFGKEAFKANSEQLKGVRIDGKSDIREIAVHGDWAWMRNHLEVTMTPADGKPTTRSGYTLTILRKKRDGEWVIARDANLLSAN